MKALHFLLVTFDAGGNIPVELLLAKALTTKGHTVSVLTNRSLEARVEAAGARLLTFSEFADFDINVPRDVEELAQILVEDFMLGAHLARDVIAAADQLDASVILVDSLLYSALAGAEKSGRPTVSIWHTVMSDARAPYHTEERLRRHNEVRTSIELAPIDSFAAQHDKVDMNLALTIPEFDAPDVRLPRNFQYAGPMFDPGTPDETWQNETKPLVVVSFSTMHLSFQAGVIQKVLDALAVLDVRGLLTLGYGLSEDAMTIPANVAVRDFIPHGEVMPFADLVICHGGYGTVTASIFSGTPVICLPLTEEEGAVADRVMANGFGVHLPAFDVDVETLREHIQTLLGDPSHAARVAELGAALVGLDASARAAAMLESAAQG